MGAVCLLAGTIIGLWIGWKTDTQELEVSTTLTLGQAKNPFKLNSAHLRLEGKLAEMCLGHVKTYECPSKNGGLRIVKTIEIIAK